MELLLYYQQYLLQVLRGPLVRYVTLYYWNMKQYFNEAGRGGAN